MSLSLFSLAGKTAWITGGNGGIGRAIALGLQAAGARVAVTGRSPDKNEAVAAELGEEGMVCQLEVTDEDAVAAAVAEITARFGRLDILVNNAGIARYHPLLESDSQTWRQVIDTNLTAAYLCAKYAARAMVAGGQGGKIINIGSIYSRYGFPNFSSYGASKAGMLGLTRALAIELAFHGIQVNAILPGWYETDMTSHLPGTPRGDEIRRTTPSGRWGQPSDAVGAAIFLASAASDFVTGIDIAVDGGYLISEATYHD